MTVLTDPGPRTYPLRTTESDPRFSDVLVHVVADLLQHHGCPLIDDGPDLDALADALHAFLYKTLPQTENPGSLMA